MHCDAGHVPLQASAGADKGAAGAEQCHEMRDAALGLFDNLRPGGLEMRLPVGIVAILIGVKISIRIRRIKLAYRADGAIGTFAPDR